MIEFIRAILMPCGVSDVNLPSFLQERLGFLDTDRWSDPDCCDRPAIFGRLDRESCHLAPLLCHHRGEEKIRLGPPCSSGCSLAPRRGCSARRGERNSLIEARAVLCSGSLSSTVPGMRSRISTGHYCPHGQRPVYVVQDPLFIATRD